MDLNTIITHLDNFVDTWQGWGKIFSNVGGFLQNLTLGFDWLSSDSKSGADVFPLTSSYIDDNAVADAKDALFDLNNYK